jgi:CelD/BcsL family acetyltransferase involved in cellulose biosynthesis
MSVVTSEPKIRNITVECVESEKKFLQLERNWKLLHLESDRPAPFLSWEWISTWWKHFGSGSKLFVLVARSEGAEIVGIAPCRIVARKTLGILPVRSLELLGYRGSAICSDHLDFLLSPSDPARVCLALVEEIIAKREKWDRLEFGDMAQDSLVPDALAGLEDRYGLTVRKLSEDRCPYLTLPAKWEELLKSMKAKRRSFIKTKRERLAAKCRIEFVRETSPENVARQLDILERLHKLARERKGEEGNFVLRAYREFHRDVALRMAKAGYLYMARLECHGTPTAIVYGFIMNKRFFYYQTGFDPEWMKDGVGSILLAMVVEDAIEHFQAKEFDFLRGTEEYKYAWTSKENVLQSCFVWNSSPIAGLSSVEFSGRKKLSNLMSAWRQSRSGVNEKTNAVSPLNEVKRSRTGDSN